jgi:hypothetical protein
MLMIGATVLVGRRLSRMLVLMGRILRERDRQGSAQHACGQQPAGSAQAPT